MKKYITFLSFILLLTSCKTADYLSKPKNFKEQVKGLYFECKVDGDLQIIGEIIEVDSTAIKILPLYTSEGIITIAKDRIETADILVALTSDNPEKIKTWSSLINIASLGHGFFAVISLPINLASSISMNSSAAKGAYRVNYPKNVFWKDISKFARFPQGIPPTIEPNSIK